MSVKVLVMCITVFLCSYLVGAPLADRGLVSVLLGGGGGVPGSGGPVPPQGGGAIPVHVSDRLASPPLARAKPIPSEQLHAVGRPAEATA